MTTDRATLLGLADMVEAASRPDRELDAEIRRSCGWVALDKHQWWSAEHVADCRQRKVSKWKYATQSLPTFTASIDAALSLYDEAPEMISTNPRLVVRDALIQKAKGMEHA